MPTTAGSRSDTLIPGEIVYHGLSGVEILDHWAEQDQNDWVKLRIQNNRDEPLEKPGDIYSEGIPIIRGRTLTEQGNTLASDVWYGAGAFGPGTINAGTSATIGLDCGPATQNAARYEVCLYKKTTSQSTSSWNKGCTEQTPTSTPSVPGPGSNDVVHNGVDDIEVTGHELVDNDDEDLIELEIEIENTGDKPYTIREEFYVAIQWFNQRGEYYPSGSPQMIRQLIVGESVEEQVQPGKTATIVRTAQKNNVETYEICIFKADYDGTANGICGWPRDG